MINVDCLLSYWKIFLLRLANRSCLIIVYEFSLHMISKYSFYSFTTHRFYFFYSLVLFSELIYCYSPINTRVLPIHSSLAVTRAAAGHLPLLSCRHSCCCRSLRHREREEALTRASSSLAGHGKMALLWRWEIAFPSSLGLIKRTASLNAEGEGGFCGGVRAYSDYTHYYTRVLMSPLFCMWIDTATPGSYCSIVVLLMLKDAIVSRMCVNSKEDAVGFKHTSLVL